MIVNFTTSARLATLCAAMLLLAQPADAHDIITTSITFNKEIVRIFQLRCTRCHSNGATAFSLTTYQESRPWAQAIKEEILSRRMPPWGAVKGFGDYRNDEALSNEQIETVLGWIDGGAPEGETNTLPAASAPTPRLATLSKSTLFATSAGLVLTRTMLLDGIQPIVVPAGASMKIIATLPDGSIEPLVWLDNYRNKFAHPFLFESPLRLPAGTRIDGVAAGARIGLLPKRN